MSVPIHNPKKLAEPTARWRVDSRPWRVVPLALFAVACTVAVTGAAAQAFRSVAGPRYAGEILRHQLDAVLFR